MTDEAPAAPVRIVIAVGDPALADRLTALLSEVDGLELVSGPNDADAVLTAAGAGAGDAIEAAELTQRELEVLSLLAEGASNKEIARRLGISAHTAKFHVGSILDKLDAVTRTDALAHAVRLGVIEL